jgi:hypothetical protein
MNLRNNGIIPLPEGGLGNQIFIYMAGYISSLYLNCPLYILNNNVTHHSNENYNKTIFKNVGIHINHSVYNIKSNENFAHYRLHNHTKEQGYDEWTVESIKPAMILQSYFQYYKPFKLYEEKIQQLLLNGLESFISKVKNIYDFDDSAFIHVRRGDYLHFSDRHFIQPIEYYVQCFQKLHELKPNIKIIYLISDDILWLKKNKSSFSELDKKLSFEIIETKNELEALSIMTLCKEGAICANSTFSWWGAYLGAYKYRNPVFAPKKWYSTKNVEIFPEEWIII